MNEPMSPPSADAVLEASNVRKRYGQLEALSGVDVRIGRGEFVALLGPNGAGKSTLFQILSGLFVADGGSVRICGLDLAKHAVQALAHVGVVFQQPALDLDLSVRGNLRFHARLHGLGREAGSRIEAALQAAALQGVAEQRCRELSGGMRRRVELARALLHEPSLLLMDEATVGLDPASRRALLEDVRARCGSGLSVLWATHLVDEAQYADRVVILHRGKKIADGSPQALVSVSDAADLGELFLELTERVRKETA